jgi:hypothetical protein
MDVFMRILIVIFIIALSGCKSSPQYLNTNTLIDQYPTIGLLTLSTESSLDPFRPELTAFYQTKIETELMSKGFRVVNADVVRDFQTEFEENSTGLFNANTGQRNETLANELFVKALQRAATELQVDAFVFIGVDTVKATFSNNIFSSYVASWYGQEETYLSDGVDAGDVLGSLFVQKTGYLPGARLYIRFRDPNNNLLSLAGGGIELLARFDDDGKVQTKTSDKLFDEEDELLQALQFAFNDLASHKQKKK